mmetsp:Transcript_26375/g.38969  ORF Transcript_26375/g.38969 Transcript_26375/m.38969 type:complete len:227 (-) Transcript_26375:816-1496(-)
MRKNITSVQTSHGNFTAKHFQKGGKGRKDTLFLWMHSKACGSCKISAFHDTTLYINFGMGLLNEVEIGGTTQIRINYHYVSLFFRGHATYDVCYRLSYHFPHCVHRSTRLIRMRIFRRRGQFQILRRLLVSSLLQVRNGILRSHRIMTMRSTFDAVNPRCHTAFCNNGIRTIRRDRGTYGGVQTHQIFSLHGRHCQSVSLEGLFQIEAGQILRRVSRNGNVVVVNH